MIRLITILSYLFVGLLSFFNSDLIFDIVSTRFYNYFNYSENNTGVNIGNGLGYEVKYIDNNKPFALQVTNKNTVYVICDVFNLEGATVSIPEGCVLSFSGGLLTNGIIVGNHTGILSPDLQIFSNDRSRFSVQGTWVVDAWKTNWFGAIDDGKAIVDKTTYEMSFSGTDNFQSIQSALDAAYITNCKRVVIKRGCYRISSGLNLGWGNEVTMTFECPETYQSATWVTDKNLAPAQLLFDGVGYAINISGGYNTVLRGISIIGKSGSIIRKNEEGLSHKFDVIDRKTNEPIIDAYSSSAVNSMAGAYSQYHPYAGIVTDAYIKHNTNGYSLPVFPSYLPKGFSSPPVPSKRVVLDAVTVAGFVVGYGISLGHGDTMNEYMKVYNSYFLSNVYAVAICTRNGRNTIFRDCYFNGNFCGITNRFFGEVHNSTSPGVGYTTVDNCSFDHSFEVVNYNTEGKYILFKNCSAEYLYHIGRTASLYRKFNELKFEDCYFITKHNPTLGSGIPFSLFRGAAIFTRCTIKNYSDTQDEKFAPCPGIVPMLINNGIVNECTFSAANRGLLYSLSSPLVLFHGKMCCFNGPEPIESSIYGAGTSDRPVLNRRSYTDSKGMVRNIGFADTRISSTVSNDRFDQHFDEKSGELQLTFNSFVFQVNMAPGDIIYNYSIDTSFAGTSFVIVDVNSSNPARVEVVARPLTGYKYSKGKYYLNHLKINRQSSDQWENGSWYVASVRNVELYENLSVLNNEGRRITFNSKVPSVVSMGDSFSTYGDYEFSNSIITGVEGKALSFDKSNSSLVPGFELCWIRKNYLDSRFWYIVNENGKPSSKMPIQQIIDSNYSYSLTIKTINGDKALIIDNIGVCYGSLECDGGKHIVVLPKNKYNIIDSKTNNIIKTIMLDQPMTISL